MKKRTMSLLSLAILNFAYAQKDSLNQKNIEEVVVTGQFTPQSINKSIYKVEVIDAAQIKNMAVTNAAEVLNQNLNILITPDSGSGDSNANILGLNGAYTKILIDNIPVVSDQGMGNNVDLTKINVNNIERIEIVKGSMGVEYGNNAVAGVINIITKKSYGKKFTANLSLQEETVGKEYDLYKKGNGRHIQSLNLGYKINDNWQLTADINHNDFQGFQGRRNGYKYFTEGNDGKRGYEWQPKDMIVANAAVRYSKNKTSLFYKINFLNEEINYRDYLVEELYLGGGNRTYVAKDADYFTKRWIHQLNVQTQIGSRINYSGDFSYQVQERNRQNYEYDVPNRQILSKYNKFTYFKSEVLYSRGMFSNFLDSEKFNFQIGYELDRTNGTADASIFVYNPEEPTTRKNIFNYANFISAEWQISDKFSVRPGARLALSDKFESQFNYSLTGRYSLGENSNLRAIFGSANRFPTYEELYTLMIDANHNIQGNENLTPETGYSLGVFTDHKFNSGSDWKLDASLNWLYLDVKDRIESVVVSNIPLVYNFLNVDNYRSNMFSGSLNVRKNAFSINSGVSVMGISQVLNTGNVTSSDSYNYFLEANLAANYILPKTKTIFALYYKYTGKRKAFVHEPGSVVSDPGRYVLGDVQDFSMLNFTLSQPFFKNHFEVALGIKNIFDVTTIRNTTLSGGNHNAAESNQNLFYGRSYFARLNYNF
ncbi:TonB-dependent receptor plug domain-containing protein [Epilithonimonas xixisoli]|uniref:Outer membrane receptor for ferrienterochelin and colicins n=1 Tax=Epilithonimonas xixisoli TaxID=1476462 RepID=A0A4R8IDG0_9FLAO|nr:TonB-dependent receptor [Epilithonimonas xixisoli]TDX86456.1 outer membrane receptor for ferrienterochelin and colicins [Epilithonimonas xixisoli]